MIVTRQASTTAPPRTICLPAAVRRRGTSLLNQQFWLWGQDIRQRNENLLLLYGFERMRPRDGIQGSRMYRLHLDTERIVALWGFGLFYGDRSHGGLYLSRFRLAPLLTGSSEAPVNVWSPTQLPAYASPVNEREWACARCLLVGALEWISEYESWVMNEMGSSYRRQCLAGWSRAVCPAEDASRLWFRLAQRCDATLGRALAAHDIGMIDAPPPFVGEPSRRYWCGDHVSHESQEPQRDPGSITSATWCSHTL